jgi:predicted transcriptional regulator of viral defense system
MAAPQSAVRDWVMARAPGTYFTTDDVPGTSGAVDSALSRLAAPDGPIQRVRQGVYWRKGAPTRFGTAKPDPVQIAFVAAGAGAGPAGASAANAVGLSTQVPRRPHIAVVGRAPKGLHGVQITARSNAHRVLLSPTEVAVLESVRDFDRFAEVPWPRARQRLRKLASDGTVDLMKLANVAGHERSAVLRDRIADLVKA